MAQDEMDTYADDGLQIIEMLSETNSGSVPTPEDLQDWADTYDFDSVANVSDSGEIWPQYEYDYGIPSITWIGPDMTVLAVDSGNTNPESYLP